MKRLTLHLLMAAAFSVSVMPVAGAPVAKRKPPKNQGTDELMQEGATFRSHGQLTGALWAYRQAAKAGDRNGAFAAGDILFKQGESSSGRDRILHLAEGLGDLFLAATHGNARACADLSSALRNGIGLKANPVSAYAWLELAAEQDPSFRSDLDRLVVTLTPDEVQQAQALARKYAQGQWPTDLVHPVDQGDPRLRVQGISSNGQKLLVIINNTSFAPGDSAIVQSAKNPRSSAGDELSITCREIGNDYALVSVAGESRFKLLSNSSLP